MEPMTLSRRDETYNVVTSGGNLVLARGILKVYGDLVIIGNAVFSRPQSVLPQ